MRRDGGTRIESYARDGKLLEVAGTAVFPVRHVNGAMSDEGTNRAFTETIQLNADGSDSSNWTTNFVDGAGQAYKTVYAPRPSVDTSPPVQQTFYNNQGQAWKSVDPDGVVNLRVINGS